MADAGVPLITGGDAPSIPGQVPGFALHEEIDAMLAAGLTPWQALSAATRTPGEFIAKTVPGAAKFGVVAPGYRAELLLVADRSEEHTSELQSLMRSSYAVFCLKKKKKQKPKKDNSYQIIRKKNKVTDKPVYNCIPAPLHRITIERDKNRTCHGQNIYK